MRVSTTLKLQLVSLIFVALCASTAFAMSPEVTQISFPSWMPAGATSSGHITFSDFDLDVAYIQFDVANGRYERVIVDVNTMADIESAIDFSLRCTSYAQEITLVATLVDSEGLRSAPEEITFTCGQPAIYNFDAEQNEVNAVEESVPLNFFIIDDGVTSLAHGAIETSETGLSLASSEVQSSIREQVMPYLSGIWDQCGIGFDLVDVWVVDPSQIELANGDLASQLFTDLEGRRVLMHGSTTGNMLRQGVFKLWNSAQKLNEDAARGFNVVLIGAPIMVAQHGSYGVSEGFSQNLWPNFAVSRLGGFVENVIPKQMIATLAHELGHNLGLNHPGEDDLYDTVSDHHNLMKGTGVAPQPRANLLVSQCVRAMESYLETKERIERTLDSTTSVDTDASVSFVNLCTDSICAGEVELSIETTGVVNLNAFSFASFEYSLDGERFTEIAVDRHYQDGFSVLWDTTELANGTYTIRGIVTDSQGARVSVEVEITIRN